MPSLQRSHLLLNRRCALDKSVRPLFTARQDAREVGRAALPRIVRVIDDPDAPHELAQGLDRDAEQSRKGRFHPDCNVSEVICEEVVDTTKQKPRLTLNRREITRFDSRAQMFGFEYLG